MLKDPTNDVALPGKTSFFDKAIRRPSFAQHISRGSGNWGKNRDRRGACRMFVRTASEGGREARVSCSGWENGRKGERGQFSLQFLALLPLCMQSVCRAIPGDSSVILRTCVVQYSVCTWINADNHCRPLSLSRVWMTKMRECTGGRRTDFSAFSCEHVLNPLAGKWKLCGFPV